MRVFQASFGALRFVALSSGDSSGRSAFRSRVSVRVTKLSQKAFHDEVLRCFPDTRNRANRAGARLATSGFETDPSQRGPMTARALTPTMVFAAKLSGAAALAVATVAAVTIISWKAAERDRIEIGTPEMSTDDDPLFSAANYTLNLLPDDVDSELVAYGKKLVEETYNHIGPAAEDEAMRFAGNELACKNCHLDAGLRKFAAPYVGVTKRFPNFRNRENRVGSIEQRINGCMERSMNGRPIPEDSREMKAFVAYMNWLGHRTDASGKVEEKGFVAIEYPDRAVDLERGKQVYFKGCSTCHGTEGLGQKLPSGHGYQFPPLAGDDSYNTGAGMHRVLTAMAFIKGNMPLGATSAHPLLRDGDAYDVAGFINSLPRPEKANTERDFPDRKLKPMSTPYPPYADDFSQEQHKYGPFQPIYEFYEETHGLKKKK